MRGLSRGRPELLGCTAHRRRLPRRHHIVDPGSPGPRSRRLSIRPPRTAILLRSCRAHNESRARGYYVTVGCQPCVDAYSLARWQLSAVSHYGETTNRCRPSTLALPAGLYERVHMETTHHVRDAIRTVTGTTFASLVLEANGPAVVEFMSYGCAHCRELEPVLQQVAEIVELEEQLFRVNIAVEEDLAERYGVAGTPTLIMFLNGQEVGRCEGPRPTLSSLLRAVRHPFQS